MCFLCPAFVLGTQEVVCLVQEASEPRGQVSTESYSWQPQTKCRVYNAGIVLLLVPFYGSRAVDLGSSRSKFKLYPATRYWDWRECRDVAIINSLKSNENEQSSEWTRKEMEESS